MTPWHRDPYAVAGLIALVGLLIAAFGFAIIAFGLFELFVTVLRALRGSA